MSIFKFETSFPFPIVKVTTLIHHTEVSKPTGVSYIILVLINESANKKEKLSNLLIQFGVPVDLHGIFADEIYKLIHELEIIKCKPYEYNRTHFSEYLVGNFVFTEKGKKVFRDELIPAAKSIESKQEVFYDPAQNLLMDKIPSDWKIGGIDSSILPNKLAEKFEYKNINQLEDYLNSVKGKGIIVKKDEIITDVSIMSNEYFYTTFPITLSIDSKNHSIDFDFGNRQLQTFFETYYDSKLIADGLGVKRKFKFKGNQPALLDAKVIEQGILMLPEDYQEILNKTTSMIITKANYMPKQTLHVLKTDTILPKMNSHIETLHIFSQDKVKAYIPAQVPLIIKSTKGIIPLNLLVEISLGQQEKNMLATELLDMFKSYSIDHAKESVYVFKVLNDRPNLELLMDKYLSKDIEENIIRLKEMKDTIDISFIKDWFNQQSKNMFEQYFKSLPVKTLEHQFAVGGWLMKHLNIQSITMIQKIIESNPNLEKEKLFQLLESLNYSLNDIFTQVSVLKVFTQKIINNDKINTIGNFSNLIKTIQYGLNQLMNITGIRRPYEFVIKEDINRTQYQEIYHGFSAKLEELLKFEKFDNSAFVELKEYNKHFKYLNNVFSEEKNATSNPKGIDQSFISSKINKKEYFTAIVYLFAKLEWILKNHYKLTGSTETMINELKKIDELKPFVSDLHQLRKTRNSLIHPTNAEVKIDSNDLTKWSNIVFKEVLKV